MKRLGHVAAICKRHLKNILSVIFQENGVKKCGCQCHKPQTIVGAVLREIEPQDEPKPGCSLCEKRKEMLRLEREKQKKIKSCPFEILGDPVLKGLYEF